MQTQDKIIHYLGLDEGLKRRKWWKPTIQEAMDVEKKYQDRLEADEVGYGLNCFFESHDEDRLEDTNHYDLKPIEIKEHITVYEKRRKGVNN